jgi:hypothetical protein
MVETGLKSLYKYADWCNDKQKRLVTHKEIYFASCKQFNDPFDCAIRLHFDLMSCEQKVALWKRILPRTELPNATDAEIDEEARDRVKRGKLEPFLRVMTESDKQQELRDNDFGLFSLSEVRDNILMWSHYAGKHTGFCVGYHVHVLDEYFRQCSESEEFHVSRYPIQYLNEYPKLNPGISDDNEYFAQQTCIKAKDWSYEREHRYVLLRDTMRPCPVPSEAIAEVIVGCKMAKVTRQEVFAETKKVAPSATLLATSQSKSHFALEILPAP